MGKTGLRALQTSRLARAKIQAANRKQTGELLENQCSL